ncbi:gamma carbonic anhydrase family protein [Brevibacterium sp. 50QC2O2]|uniref:gamma carbonic anhydrase family protein n=1 Tax=Brevibacterium sp. 50QC2O2 TaxID=2968459 RepID=UPI00211C06DB|nr:gamma carbonic anhydrase family protein [Brevibacterium sp. 50QC2O2]MCQ9387418.1 gamma carbonic anhydrase family protein [Brevibacterium sp. 50QC2O2]
MSDGAKRRPGDLADVTLIAIDGVAPTIHPEAFVAPGVTLIGDVRLAAGAAVYYGCVLRAEGSTISIGEGSNVQDNTVMHSDPGKPVTVGARVSIGHRALVHGCTVDDDVLIGMSATVLNRAHIGSRSLIAAGAVVLEDAVIPPESLVAGVPAKVRRAMGEKDIARVLGNAKNYEKIRVLHREHGEIITT